MLREVYEGPYWPDFDRGTIEYEEAARRLSEQFGGRYEAYMKAITGWIHSEGKRNISIQIQHRWKALCGIRRDGQRVQG